MFYARQNHFAARCEDKWYAKGTKRGLDKVESIIRLKNIRRSGILCDNIHDEIGDGIDNLTAVAKKVDPNSHEYNHQQT